MSLTLVDLDGTTYKMPSVLGAPYASHTSRYLAAVGAALNNRADRGVSTLNLRNYGALGDGVTDDTAAVQRFFTAADSANAVLSVPSGTYNISSTITCKGTVSTALRVFGEQGMSRGLGGGSIFKWTGAAGGKMFKFRGLNNSLFENLTFHGNSLADCTVHSCEYVEAAGANLRPSQNVFWDACQFVGVRNNASADSFRVGLDDATQTNLQTSEYVWNRCYFASSGAGASRSGIYIQTPGNCKNFVMRDCVILQTDYGWYQPLGEGTTTIDSCFISNTGYNTSGWAIYMASGQSLNVTALRIENGGTGYRAGAVFGANGCSLNMSGGYFDGIAPTDDYVVNWDGPAIINGVRFQWNERVGSNVCKIKLGNPVARASLVAVGNYFGTNTTAIQSVPVYDGSNNHIIESDYAKGIRLNVTCIGNKSSIIPAGPDTRLADVTGMPLRSNYGSPLISSSDVGPTYSDDGEKFIAVIPYSAFSVAALTKTLSLATLQTFTNVKNVVVRTTANMSGIAGPVTCEVGTNASTNAFTLSHTVSAGTPTKGIAAADLGAELASGTRAHPNGYFVTSGTPTLQIKLTSAAGNLSGLTSGSITVVVEYEYTGP